MAKIDYGIMGNVRGKLGDNIYYVRNRKQYVRQAPVNKSNTNSPAQVKQRRKMALAIQFAKTINKLIKISYPERHQLSPCNLLVKQLLRQAIKEQNDTYTIDYGAVHISRGSLYGPGWVQVLCKDNAIHFSWVHNTNSRAAHDDKAILVAYCEALGDCIFITAGPNRSLCEAILDVTAFSGHEVHTWLGFIAANGRQASDSVYTGAIMIA